jgi:hypothetical protein
MKSRWVEEPLHFRVERLWTRSNPSCKVQQSELPNLTSPVPQHYGQNETHPLLNLPRTSLLFGQGFYELFGGVISAGRDSPMRLTGSNLSGYQLLEHRAVLAGAVRQYLSLVPRASADFSSSAIILFFLLSLLGAFHTVPHHGIG